jgi:carbon starvation protein
VATTTSIFNGDLQGGLLAHAEELSGQLAAGQVPAEKIAEIRRLVFNDRLDAAVCAVFMVLVAVIVVEAVRAWAWAPSSPG